MFLRIPSAEGGERMSGVPFDREKHDPSTWVWSECCLFPDGPLYPYGFCEDCWVLHGKPVPAGVEEE